MIDPTASSTATSKSKSWWRVAGMIAGALLLGAALYMVWRQRETLSAARAAIQSMPTDRLVLYLAVAAGSVVLNIVLSALLFSALMSRYGKVGLLEMQALIASATLMNYVPLRPGFFGRIAYHRAVNQIAVVDSTKTVLAAAGLSAAIAGYLALAVTLSAGVSIDLRLLVALPLAAILIGAAIAKGSRLWLLAASARYAEVLVIAARYLAVFALIGSPIDFRDALAFGCVSMIAGMVPFFGNGLGLREWAIGLVAPLLTAYQMELGMTADLVNRAVELTVALAAGSIGLVWLAGHNRSRARRPHIE
ncbi:MAG: hypothetical protein L0Y44_08275 [Phycisphaerales bacterium]|nr:hypothetical protein [Phycisphaerales bacterium]MCI0674187.1 hypothetical protein [Phycisphaerales bacterium]